MGDLSNAFRQIERLIGKRSTNFLQVHWSSGKDVTKLGQMASQCVDHLRALSDKTLMRSVGDCSSLMLSTLDRHIMQIRPNRRLGNVILLWLDEQLHVDP
tara:strand:+ start:1071 stop:1370 length:300 start_codon:yes stop_codon:yes gene_type:complete